MPRLDDVAGALRAGAVVGLPTDTVYGIAALARRPEACRRIFALKGRPDGLALPVLVAGIEQAAELADAVVLADLARLAHQFWPGPLTVVVPRRKDLDPPLELGGDGGAIGLRAPDEELVRWLCAEVGPLATTSANRHGGPPARNAEAVRRAFGDELAAIVDGGRREGSPSSVVSLVGQPPRSAVLLREGPVSLEQVLAVLEGSARS